MPRLAPEPKGKKTSRSRIDHFCHAYGRKHETKKQPSAEHIIYTLIKASQGETFLDKIIPNLMHIIIFPSNVAGQFGHPSVCPKRATRCWNRQSMLLDIRLNTNTIQISKLPTTKMISTTTTKKISKVTPKMLRFVYSTQNAINSFFFHRTSQNNFHE